MKKQYFMSKIGKTAPKLCTLAVSVAMLSACQSVVHQNFPETDNLALANVAYSQQSGAQALFSDNESSQARLNKKALIDALTKHLSSEHYALGTYVTKGMPITKSSIDDGADTLFESAIKTHAYKTQPPKSNAFRTWGEYFSDDNGDLPYLRYDDEAAGRDVGLTRRERNDLDYLKASTALFEMSDELHSTIYNISYVLDELVNDSPKITTNDKRVKAQLDRLAKARQNFDDMGVKNDLTKAGGYIPQDFRHLQECAAIFDKGIRQALSPNRKHQSDDNFVYYNLAYKNYDSCYQAKVDNAMLEPSIYADTFSLDQLQYYAASKQCRLTNKQNIEQLFQQGKTYAKDGDLFLQSYIDQENCSEDAFAKGYDEYKPTHAQTYEDTQRQRDAQAQFADFYEYERQNQDESKSIASYFDAYKRMKAEEKSGAKFDDAVKFGGFLGAVFNKMKLSPEQITAKNLYSNDRFAITTLAHYEPNLHRGRELVSLDFYSPTISYSAQLPILADFNQEYIKADVSALLPLMAVITPENAPLPKDVPNQEMTFTLPAQLQGKIPMTAVYDATHQGFLAAFETLNPENITAVDVAGDKFARQIGANRAYKVHFGTKEEGQFVATIIKHITKTLKNHIDSHPDDYLAGDASKIKRAIDDLTLINDGYQTHDAGGLWQAVEGILPIQFWQSVYFYVNAQGEIVGIQSVTNRTNHLLQATQESVQQIRYAKKPFNHPLSDKFTQSFQTNETFDGTAWLQKTADDIRFKNAALKARINYDDAGDEYDESDEYGLDDEVWADETDDEKF